MVRCRSVYPAAVGDSSPQGTSERRDCERRDALQKVKRAWSVTAAQLTELRGYAKNSVESPFFHGVEPERRVRMRPAAIALPRGEEITSVKLPLYCFR